MAISTNLGDIVKYIPSGDSQDSECTIATIQGMDKDGNLILSLPGGKTIVVDDDKYVDTDLSITF